MNRFFKTFSFIALVTGLSLGYVASKVESVKLSYEIRAKEKRLAQHYEDFRNLKYRLASLKSPAQLENRMLDTHLELVPVKEVRILRFVKKPLPQTVAPRVGTEWTGAPRGFLTVPEAQANPDK